MEEVSLEKRTYGADEVASLLGVSRAYAYKVIRRLNEELEAEGMLTIPGKVSAAYLESRYFGGTTRGEDGDRHVG
jgi:transposase